MRRIFTATAVIASASLLAAGGCKPRSIEQRAEDATAKGAGVVSGVGKGLQKQGEAAKNLGEGVATVVKAVGNGLGKGLFDVELRPAESLKAQGLEATVCQVNPGGDTPEHDISVYVIGGKDGFRGRFVLKAFRADEKEIGRIAAEAALAGDEAKYVKFPLAKEVPVTDIKYFTLEAKPATEKPAP